MVNWVNKQTSNNIVIMSDQNQQKVQNLQQEADGSQYDSLTSIDTDSEIVIDDTVSTFDVVCGRHKYAFNNVGNRRFRVLVSFSLYKYVHIAKSRKEKSDVIKEIITAVNTCGGRFLASVKGEWKEVSFKEARAKVGHALRDMAQAREMSIKQEPQLPSSKEIASVSSSVVNGNTLVNIQSKQVIHDTVRTLKDKKNLDTMKKPPTSIHYNDTLRHAESIASAALTRHESLTSSDEYSHEDNEFGIKPLTFTNNANEKIPSIYVNNEIERLLSHDYTDLFHQKETYDTRNQCCTNTDALMNMNLEPTDLHHDYQMQNNAFFDKGSHGVNNNALDEDMLSTLLLLSSDFDDNDELEPLSITHHRVSALLDPALMESILKSLKDP